jgi:glycosyltransferase involved in cell wall biosynthesis
MAPSSYPDPERQMKVSVLITTYNHEKFIAIAIDSALTQQVNFDYEIVIGEDCSTDRTRLIVQDFQRRHPDKIRLLLPDKNLGSSRNYILTLQACKGEYIAILEGDDYWTSPFKLQRQVDFLDNHPECSLCFHNVKTFWEDRPQESWNHNVVTQKEISTLEDILEGDFLATSSVMFRRSVFHKIPEWFYPSVGDWSGCILCAQHGKIGYINEVMGAYRKHRGGMWSQLSRIQQLEQIIRGYEGMNANLNFSYDKTIKGLMSIYYYELAIEYERKEELEKAGHLLKKCIHKRPSKLEEHLSVTGIESTEVWKMLRKKAWFFEHPSLYRFDKRLQPLKKYIDKIRTVSKKFMRQILKKSTGTISAQPCLIWVSDGSGRGKTTLSWTSSGTTDVEVHVGSPDGSLFSRSGPSGSTTTDKWVRNDMIFYLQDVTNGLPLISDNTLATVTVRVETADEFPSPLEEERNPSRRPEVSVVVIFLNAEKFIQEAIESVFAQTYDNWELLLVDDGSTDGSSKIALEYAERYGGKVRYLEHKGHENRGTSAARNLGIRHAQGEYIAFLDADDVWLPHKLERQVTILVSQPEVGMVYGPVQFWYSWTGKPEDANRDFITKTKVEPDTLIKPPELLPLLLRDEVLYPLHFMMVRRDVALRIGGFEDTFRFLFDDLSFAAKVCLDSPVFVAGECWSKYRQQPDDHSDSPDRKERYHLLHHSFLNWLDQYLTKQGIKDAEVWEALREKQRPYRKPVLYGLLRNSRHLLKEAKWLLDTTKVAFWTSMRRIFGRSTGTITADPNPIRSNDRLGVGATTLSWTLSGTKKVEVRVNSPDGPLFSRSDSSGSATTGKWVTDGMVFYLQDVSSGKTSTLTKTLALVKVCVLTDISRSRSPYE